MMNVSFIGCKGAEGYCHRSVTRVISGPMRTRRLASPLVLILPVLVVGAASVAVPAAAAGPAAAAASQCTAVLLAALSRAASLTVRGASATAVPSGGPLWGVR
jgi:hypothetical protein